MRSYLSSAVALFLFACGPNSAWLGETDETGLADSALVQPKTLNVHLVFLHGVQWTDSARLGAAGSLASLEGEVLRKLDGRAAEFRAKNPGVTLKYRTYRINLYTDADGVLRSPSIDDGVDGTGVPVANRWRSSLQDALRATLPPDARNIILIGHSTGARVAMELAANVGGNGVVGGQDWGWQDRIAGVVTVNGMIDALNSRDYNFLGTLSYVSGCKVAQSAGWCEYSGLISAVPAATWVAQNRRALMLISAGPCSPSLWTGESDQALPLRAQGSPAAAGMSITPYPGKTFGPAHGVHYGAFCHTDITNTGSARHLAAREEVSSRIVGWLLDSAPRAVAAVPSAFESPALGTNQWSARYEGGAGCGTAERESGFQVLGTCVHPGFFDGDDHPFDGNNRVELQSTGACRGNARWLHTHSGLRPGRLWVKLTSEPVGGGLLSTLQ